MTIWTLGAIVLAFVLGLGAGLLRNASRAEVLRCELEFLLHAVEAEDRVDSQPRMLELAVTRAREVLGR